MAFSENQLQELRHGIGFHLLEVIHSSQEEERPSGVQTESQKVNIFHVPTASQVKLNYKELRDHLNS